MLHWVGVVVQGKSNPLVNAFDPFPFSSPSPHVPGHGFSGSSLGEGPGPRVAVTIPLILPTTDSIEGATDVSMTLSLNTRDQLASMTAYQVRRGWDGPYAEVIAANSAASTDFSADWLAFPGQLQMLNDYVGWVQTSPTMPEVVYHAGGDPVKFNIQVAQISSHAEGGESL